VEGTKAIPAKRPEENHTRAYGKAEEVAQRKRLRFTFLRMAARQGVMPEMSKRFNKPEAESSLVIEYISPKKIKENPKNSRKHPINQIKLIEKSIRRYGFTSPLLIDKKGFVLAGHGRLMAAKNLGISSIPVVRLSLSGDKAREYLIADNAIPMLSKWDKGILKFELDELKLGNLS